MWGSPHAEGMTMKLMQRALDGARAEGATVKLMHLATEELNPCRGCGGRCFDTQACLPGPGGHGAPRRDGERGWHDHGRAGLLLARSTA